MTKQELQEIFKLLDEANVNYMLCSEATPVSLTSVPCGSPTELGEEDIDDYILLPKKLLGQHPEMFVPCHGDSMKDVGYEPGDLLRVRFGIEAQDGDNVLAYIDGTCTVKSLFTDEDGTKWLVPQNDNYKAIHLTEDMNAQILGVVVAVEKGRVRASSRQMLQSVRRAKNMQRSASRLSEEKVDNIIITIGSAVKHARQWYAVFRAMVDYGLMSEDSVQEFCERVKRLLPEHEHLPAHKELSRMAVQSFAKQVSMWRPDNAPVSGARYMDYLSIAQMTDRLLGGEEA
ncbi:MAG: hypothetical protein J5733_10350 [Bacteroidaceae bacterium]|nr:hypothetical protein [Bacteroidaceae bacterium]